MNKLPRYEMVYDEENDEAGIYAISFVEDAANEVEFFCFGNQTPNEKVKFQLDEKKQDVISMVLIPNQVIYRKDPETGREYEVFMSEENIRKYMIRFSQRQNQNNVNFNHDENQVLDGITYYQNWQIEDPATDKINNYPFPKDKIVKGAWVSVAHVSDPETYKKVEMGELGNGFSIEAFLPMQKIDFQINKTKLNKQEDMSYWTKLANIIFKNDKQKFASVMTEAGEVYADTFEVGGIAYLNDAVYPNAEFVADGKTIKTDEFGVIISAEPMEAPEMDMAGEGDMTQADVEVADAAASAAQDAADDIADELDKPVEAVDVEALKSRIAELEKEVENLTKAKEGVLSENTALKSEVEKFKKAPAVVNLKSNVSTTAPRNESYMSALARIIKTNK